MSNKTIKEISDLINENQEKGISKIKIETLPQITRQINNIFEQASLKKKCHKY